jgi:imidazolonepropionase-like amidohydrolase
MGVEQIMYDAFFRALDYLKKRDAYSKLGKKEKILAIPPRIDLELEALGEILEHERFITCHSYRQSEINMIIKLADSMGFRLNTFTHILEGYKVADKMKKHGAGASTFSDWWAYKYEVIHAIPYNAALLSKVGVVTAINSDDNEMGRRLNQEAAKAVRYGGVSEEEAWKMVTLYPAKLLQIDHKVGSVRVGKDADLVLWSGNPLSIYARAEKTFVDGVLYFDLEKEQEKQAAIKAEKTRLIQLMLKKNKYLIPKKKPVEHKEQEYHCNDVEQYTETYGHE